MNIFLPVRILILLFWGTCLLTSCGSNDLDTTLDDTPAPKPKFGPNFKFYTDSNLFYKSQSTRTIGKDPFTINEVRSDNEKIIIYVSYSGGCKEHNFDVVWDGVVDLSPPGKLNLIIKHNANEDSCEALIDDKIELNLNTYFNNLVKAKNTVFTVSNASSIQEVSSKY